MLFSQLIIAMVMCCFSSALNVKNLEVMNYFKNETVLLSYKDFGADTVVDQQVKLIEVDDPFDVFVVKFSTVDGPPHNAELLLGYPELHQEVVYDIVESNDVDLFAFAIRVDTLDRNLLALYDKNDRKPMPVTLIISNEDDTENINRVLFYMNFEGSAIDGHLAALDKVPEKEFAIKKEMAHTFNKPPTQAPAFVARVFSLIIITAFAALFVAWSSMGAYNFDNMPKSNSIYFVGFLGTIIGFEYIFAQYQFGVGIFETIYKAFCLGVPGIWMGAKFLRSLDKPL
ncbi:Dolichyl-diphosphooligosaccharide--protein glycosyltransferase subunit SWP1 [Nakaseomyces bracarensis]|uniref:Dolichyl-diphosphooligosaccharide--protein glycosyltransferase subunit SWP1 n=1 Tax=Nakaseomyces bracarensis TaxID=273131 RepID=A0ABR4NPR4_9SACH